MESGGHGFLPPEPAGPEPDLGGAPRAQPSQQQQPQQQQQQPPPPGWQPPPWSYQPSSQEPDNGAAVAGFVTSVVSGALLLMSFGFLGVFTLIAAPFGIHYSRKGKRAVDEGKTRKHRGLAQAGFVIGIVTLVISAIVPVLLIIFIIARATDEEFRRDFENDGGFDSTTVSAVALAVRPAGAAIRLLA
jgi:hypothetical protein